MAFVQRFKGKVTFDAGVLAVAGQALYGNAAVQALSTASATVIINGAPITTILSSSGLTVWRLQKPMYANQSKTIMFPGLSSGAIVTASTDGSVTINGSSINTTFKSTVPMSVELVATSSANWAITGIFPSTLGMLVSTSS